MARRIRVAWVATAVVLLLGAFGAGRWTAGHPGGGHPGVGTYWDGLRAGEALGVQEGRTLQEGAALPADDRRPVQDAFTAGYTAGANDVFGGYDGGWRTGVPYVVVLGVGTGSITYRIVSREEARPGSTAGVSAGP